MGFIALPNLGGLFSGFSWGIDFSLVFLCCRNSPPPILAFFLPFASHCRSPHLAWQHHWWQIRSMKHIWIEFFFQVTGNDEAWDIQGERERICVCEIRRWRCRPWKQEMSCCFSLVLACTLVIVLLLPLHTSRSATSLSRLVLSCYVALSMHFVGCIWRKLCGVVTRNKDK